MSQSNKLSLWQKLKRLLSSNKATTTPDINDGERATNSQALASPSSRPLSSESQSTSDDSLSPDNDLRERMLPSHKEPRHSTTSQPKASSQQGTTENRLAHTTLPDEMTQTAGEQDAPITTRIQQYLNEHQWHFLHHLPKSADHYQTHHLSMRMKNDDISWVCLFRIQERTQLVATYGILPFSIPESHRKAAMLLITQLNYDMILGNLELDLTDGEIRFKTALDIEATGISDAIIHYLLQSVIAMTTVAYELFSDLLESREPSQDLDGLLSEIRQQADARTFYLASDEIQ